MRGGGWNEKECIPDGFLTPALGWDCFFPPLSSPPLLLIKFAAYQSGSLVLSWEVLLHQQHLSIKSLWKKGKEKHGSLPKLCDFFDPSTVLYCSNTALVSVTAYNLPQLIIKGDKFVRCYTVSCNLLEYNVKGILFHGMWCQACRGKFCRLLWFSHLAIKLQLSLLINYQKGQLDQNKIFVEAKPLALIMSIALHLHSTWLMFASQN